MGAVRQVKFVIVPEAHAVNTIHLDMAASGKEWVACRTVKRGFPCEYGTKRLLGIMHSLIRWLFLPCGQRFTKGLTNPIEI
jgi:hypothetical protein